MKKLVATVLAVSLLLPAVAFASSTDTRGAFEFCELFAQRFTELVIDGELDYKLYIDSGYLPPFEKDGRILVSVTPGMMCINKEDYTVHSLEMKFIDANASDKANEQNIMVCIAALSALEYDYIADDLFVLNAKAFGGSASAIEEALSIWNDRISVRLTDKILQHIVDTGDRTLVYAGNYDYYVGYYSAEIDGKQLDHFTLTAEEHK